MGEFSKPKSPDVIEVNAIHLPGLQELGQWIVIRQDKESPLRNVENCGIAKPAFWKKDMFTDFT